MNTSRAEISNETLKDNSLRLVEYLNKFLKYGGALGCWGEYNTSSKIVFIHFNNKNVGVVETDKKVELDTNKVFSAKYYDNTVAVWVADWSNIALIANEIICDILDFNKASK